MKPKSCCIVIPCGCLLPLTLLVIGSVAVWARGLF